MWSAMQHLSYSEQAAASVLLLLATVAVGQWAYERFAHSKNPRAPTNRPRGTLPFLFNTVQIVRYGHRWCDWMVEECVHFRSKPFVMRIVGGPEIVTLSSPELFEDVLKTQFEAFDKGSRMNEILHDLLGDGIFGVDGHKWVHQRKTASNLFSLRSLRESMTESIQKHALVLNGIFERAAASNERIDMFKLLNRFTIETFAEIGFGVELGALTAAEESPFQAAFDNAQRILMIRFMRPRWYWMTQRALNIGRESELKQHIKTIDDTVLGIVAQALEKRTSQTHADREAVVGKRDIVSLFLDNVSHDASSTFDPVFLRDIVVNFLIAGRDTTAQALSWFFYLLSEHPHVEAKIRAELTAKLPQLLAGAIATPSMEQTSELVYLEAALRETLRLHPSVPMNVKVANRDVTLCDGTFIREGQVVNISSYVLARMTHVWGDDAKQFKPERWIDTSSGKILPASAFKFPAFHAGPRMCLGMNLAMTEMKIVAAMVLSKFHLALVPGQNVTYDLSLTHPIKGELLMTVEPAVVATSVAAPVAASETV